jgi:putative SOS response-associated peptidase YedK
VRLRLCYQRSWVRPSVESEGSTSTIAATSTSAGDQSRSPRAPWWHGSTGPGLLQKHRLIVPADGFYEWRRGPDLARQAFYVRRTDGRPLALAGLWASWHDPDRPRDDAPLRSATILTTEPNSLMGQIHNRMPVILFESDWDRWPDPAIVDIARFMALLAPARDDLLEAIPVGPRVNSVRNQGPELIEAVGPALVG